MKKWMLVAISMLTLLALAACSGDNMDKSNSMTGAWTMTLANASGEETLKANVNMTEMSGGMMNMDKMGFTMQSPCFGPDHSMEGQMSNMQDMMGNRMNMDMTMHMWSGVNKSGNHLEMKLTMNFGMNSGSGTYILTGVAPGCQSETGTVVMSRMVQ